MTSPPTASASTAATSGPESAFVGATVIEGVGGFASPTGRLQCSVGERGIVCIGGGLGGSRPPADESRYCDSDGNYGINGVSVGATAGWSCGGGLPLWPVAEQQRWWRGRGFPTVTVGNAAMAVLPYGHALRAGRFACVSRVDGVTCRNSTTGAALFINRELTQLSGPLSLQRTEGVR